MKTDTNYKGTPVHVQAVRDQVEVWVSSPTGDASDSFTYTIPCLNETQAQNLANIWCETWGLPVHIPLQTV
jgi:hypothetical protein